MFQLLQLRITGGWNSSFRSWIILELNLKADSAYLTHDWRLSTSSRTKLFTSLRLCGKTSKPGMRLSLMYMQSTQNLTYGATKLSLEVWLQKAMDASYQLHPNFYAIFKVLLTMPVSITSAERPFNTLRRLKTYLRNTMSQERFSGLALKHIHRNINRVINDLMQLGTGALRLCSIIKTEMSPLTMNDEKWVIQRHSVKVFRNAFKDEK